jgi:hypothetical protein
MSGPTSHDSETTETTYLVWACVACNRSHKVQPEVFKPNCRCEKPVPALRPTMETQVRVVPRRCLSVVPTAEG